MESMKVIKRNGTEVTFDISKIVAAITKANNTIDESIRMTPMQIQRIAESVELNCVEMGRSPSVEEIQDLVEHQIMAHGAFEVAKNYITYRYTRTLVRQSNTTDEKILSLIECCNEEAKQENSNKNPVVNSTQRDYMAGEVSRDLSERILLPHDIVEAHNQGIIHFHDSDYFAQHMHNCFTETTKFVTKEGLRPFSSCLDGEVVTVLDKDGVWREATVHQYGKQQMMEVSLASGTSRQTVHVTADHRWILKDGTVTTTLKEGDRLWALQDTSAYDVQEYLKDKELAEAFCLGFILGDGCDRTQPNGSSDRRVRLCGDKNRYAPIFQFAGYRSTNAEKNSDDRIYYKNTAAKQDFLNLRGWRFMSFSQKVALFRGLLAADGSESGGRIATSDARIMELIENVSCLAGYHVTSSNDTVHDTNYKEGAECRYYYFMRYQNENASWRVLSIKPMRRGYYEHNAWCVEEPVTHSFTLEHGIVTGNCDLVNLEDMLQNGTVITGTLIERPHSFSTACNIATQIIAQVASNQYGGQSISLTHLAPFVDVSRQKIRKTVLSEMEVIGAHPSPVQLNRLVEDRLREEVRRGVQTIQYQVVTLLTTNGQAPFISVFMYLGEARNPQEKQDLALIIEEVLEQRYQGTKNESGVWVTPAFPKLIYVLEEDNIHEDSPYWYLTKLAAKCTAKRMVPDYISEKIMLKLKIDKNGEGHCYTCMGCRSFLTPYVDPETNQPKYYGRFNQGVVTINLPDVALSSGGNEDKFWKIFDERLELCHKALMCRHNRLKGTVSDVAPILWQYGALARLKKGEVIDKLLYGGYSTISLGYAGLYECVKYMTGKSHTDPEATPFALKIMEHMNAACRKWKAEHNIDFSLYGTPLESTTYKFAKCLQRRFGIIPGITDKSYITNSYHVHVTEQINAFDKLKFEAQFQHLSPGGAISYVEVPDMQDNLEAVLQVMKFIYDNIMYAELNTKSDYCQECGWDGEIDVVNEGGKLIWKCPQCGNTDQNKMNVARRTCGYIGTQFWNQGRTQEIKERVLHL